MKIFLPQFWLINEGAIIKQELIPVSTGSIQGLEL